MPTKTESSETSKVFIRRKKSTVCVDRHTGGLRELHPCGSLSHLYGHFFQVSFGQSFWFDRFWVRIWYISGPSHVCTCISHPRWIPVKRPMGSLTSLPFWPPRTFIDGKVSLTLRMRNMWSLIFYLGKAQPPLSIILLLWSFCPQGTNSSCSAWGPSISCLVIYLYFIVVAHVLHVISKNPFPDPTSCSSASIFSSKRFIILVFSIQVWDSFWVNFCIWCEVRVQLHSFAFVYPVVLALFV